MPFYKFCTIIAITLFTSVTCSCQKQPQPSDYAYNTDKEDWINLSPSDYIVLAKVAKDDKYGFIDKSGKVVIPVIYDQVGEFRNGVVWVQKGGKAGVLDNKGRVIIPLKYKGTENYMPRFRQGLTIVENFDGNYAYFNNKGEQLSDFRPTYLTDFEESVIVSQENYVVNNKLDTLLKLPSDAPYRISIRPYKNGLALFSLFHFKDLGWPPKIGYLNLLGEMQIQPIYTNTAFSHSMYSYDKNEFDFSNGRALVSTDNGQQRFINKEGKILTWSSNFSQLNRFPKYGVTQLHNGRDSYLVDINGKNLLPEGYEPGASDSGGASIMAAISAGNYFLCIHNDSMAVYNIKTKQFLLKNPRAFDKDRDIIHRYWEDFGHIAYIYHNDDQDSVIIYNAKGEVKQKVLIPEEFKFEQYLPQTNSFLIESGAGYAFLDAGSNTIKPIEDATYVSMFDEHGLAFFKSPASSTMVQDSWAFNGGYINPKGEKLGTEYDKIWPFTETEEDRLAIENQKTVRKILLKPSDLMNYFEN